MGKSSCEREKIQAKDVTLQSLELIHKTLGKFRM
jgi:hypothetical protein